MFCVIARIAMSLLCDLPPEFLGDMAPAYGAFYIYADLTQLSETVLNSVDFADALLREAHVACTPGVDFDRELVISTFGSPMPAAQGHERS